MSTNFYVGDGRLLEEWHLGQRAGGWQFEFRAYPDLGIVETQAWLRQLNDALWIKDEYQQRYTIDEFLEAVEACQDGKPRGLYGNDWRDRYGNTFCASEFS